MKKALQFLRKNPEINFFICAFILWTALMCYENAKEGGDFKWHDLKVEANGMIFDLFVFGILVTTYNAIRARKEKIERLKEEIDDYRGWDEKEAMYRIVGAVKRLNKEGISKIDLSYSYLALANLANVELDGATFVGAFLENANLSDATLKSAIFSGKRFGQFVSSKKAILRGANLDNANLQEAKFEGTDLKGVYLNNAKLQKASFYRADLTGAELKGADLTGADLTGADLTGANLTRANLTGANLTGANLTGAFFYFIEYAGMDEDYNETNYEERAILVGVELSGANVDLNWFEKLREWNIQGWKEITSGYTMDSTGLLLSK